MNRMFQMSSAQKRIFALEQLQKDSINYNVPFVFKIKGRLDAERLNHAFWQLCKRHEPLRTFFNIKKDKFVQVIPDEADVNLMVKSSTLDKMEADIKEFVRPFQLLEGPLIRMQLVDYEDGSQVLMIDTHHIIFDGASIQTLLYDLNALYLGEELPELEIQFKDFSSWLSETDLSSEEQYWENELKQITDETAAFFPTDHERPKHRTFNGSFLKETLNDETSELISKFCIRHGLTESSLFLTALLVLLSKYNYTESAVVGIPTTGRSIPEAEDMIGMFVNTLIVQESIKGDDTFAKVNKKVQEKSILAFEHQNYPFEQLVQKSSAMSSENRNPIFDTMYSFEIGSEGETLLGDCVCEAVPVNFNVSKFDLTLTVMKSSNRLFDVHWEYNRELYSEDTISLLHSHYMELIHTVLLDSSRTIDSITCVSKQEEILISEELSPGKQIDIGDYSVAQMFEETVRNTPKNTALIFGNERVSYERLNNMANHLSNELIPHNIEKGEVVGIQSERSVEMIAAILAVLKVGAVYLPIDPNAPEQRVQHMTDECEVRFILIFTDSAERAAIEGIEYLPITLSDERCEFNPVKTEDTSLIYIIYTSGSTGRPKGVSIHNIGLKNLVKWQVEQGNVDHTSVFLQKSTYIFDASIWEIFTPLLSGAALQLLTDQENSDFKQLSDIIVKNHISHSLLIPSFFNEFLNYLEETKRTDVLNNMTRLYLGAEALSGNLLKKFTEITGMSASAITNLYGPTEGTVAVTYYDCKEVENRLKTPIGRPVSNTKIHILNKDTPTGIGMIGEICFSGINVSTGYINNETMTEKNFKDIFTLSDRKVYRTGDLGRWLASGEIEYLGRIDNQVKIRGFRIELEEIEKAINLYEGVKASKVKIFKEEDSSYICAYIISKQELELDGLNTYLKSFLPSYMIPEHYIFMEQFLYTDSGKIDLNKFPKPEVKWNEVYLAPETSVEEDVVSVLEPILGKTKISLSDSFLRIGGDSIKAIRFIARMRDLGYELNLRSLMESSSLKQICQKITKSSNDETGEHKNVSGELLVSPIQKYFYQLELKNPEHFNQSMVLKSSYNIHSEHLERCFEILVNQHDILRMTVDNGVQQIASEGIKNIKYCKTYDFAELSFDEAMKEMTVIGNEHQAVFNLAAGPLMQVLLFKMKKVNYIWVICHHLVIDSISWNILIDDLTYVYETIVHGGTPRLIKTTSYQDWVLALKNQTDFYKYQTKDWKDVNKKIEQNRLFDEPMDSVSVINHERTANVIIEDFEEWKDSRFSMQDLILTSVLNAVKGYWGLSTIPVTMEGHGRNTADDTISLDRTVGWFTNMYPVIFQLEDNSVRNLTTVKETLRRVPDNGMGYSVLSTYAEDLDFLISDIAFNYLGNISESVQDQLFLVDDKVETNDISENNVMKSPITITCYIRNNCLNYSLLYHSPTIHEKQAEEFLEAVSRETTNLFHKAIAYKDMLTASDFGEFEWSDREFKKVYEKYCLKETIQYIMPLTNMQEGMLYSKLINEESTAYFIQCAYELDEDCDLKVLQQAFHLLSETYAALRTAIVYRDVRVPRQIVFSDRKIELEIVEYKDGSSVEEQLQMIKEEHSKQNFDLENHVLFRAGVLISPEENPKLIVSFHHIIMDGWCMSTVLDTLNQYYQSIRSGTLNVDLYEPAVNDDVIKKYMDIIKRRDKKKSFEYWNGLLAGFDEQGEIYSAGTGKQQDENEVNALFLSLTEEQTQAVKDYVRDHDITMSSVLETAWGVVLMNLQNTNDVVFGKVVSGRNVDVPGIVDAVGLFINTIPLRITTNDNDRISDVLQSVHKQNYESSEHDYCLLSDIQQCSNLKEYLLNTSFVFENYGSFGEEAEESVIGEVCGYREQTIYPIAVSAGCNENISIKLMYDTKKYGEIDGELILNRFRTAIIQLTGSHKEYMGDIHLLTEDEAETLEMFNDNSKIYKEQTVIDLFEAKAMEYPDSTAVTGRDTRVTFEELKNRSDMIAQNILQQSGNKEVVGLLIDRRAETIPVIYGVLRADCAFLPIMPNLPLDRMNYMITDSSAKLLITQKKYEHIAKQLNLNYLVLEDLMSVEPAIELPEISLDDNAYIIYTSGTTGRPKGVLVRHRSLSNVVQWQSEYMHLNHESKLIQQFAFAFDGAVPEYFSSITAGGTLDVIDDDSRNDFKYVLSRLEGGSIIVVSSYLSAFLDFIEKFGYSEELAKITQLGLAGETASVSCINKFRELTNYDIPIHNLYGPTEATVCATAYTLEHKSYDNVPIGKPVSNADIFIRNKKKDVCGIGVPGEMCIGGICLSAGYINNEEMNKKAFDIHPYNENEKVYRTGDCAMWMADGTIKYLGRIDTQVKIRGLRIEVEEIASCMKEYPDVVDAVAAAKTIHGEEVLCAYIIAGSSIDAVSIEDYVKSKLPAYMIPQHYTFMESFPTTLSGKIDTKSLPIPSSDKQDLDNFIEPEGEMQVLVAECFSNILGREKISALDNFFNIGGHSLKATQLVNTLNQKFEVSIPLSKIMVNGTVREITDYIVQIQGQHGIHTACKEDYIAMTISEEDF